MAKPSNSSKRARWWRRFGPIALMSGLLLLAGGGAFWKTNRDLGGIRQRQDRIEQLHRGSMSMHAAADAEMTDVLASIIPDLREVVETVSPEERKDEIEKRLVEAWQLLEESKKTPKEDYLDCRQLHTVMVEIRDKADSILHLGWSENPESAKENPESAKKVALIAAPLARIQSKSGRGTRIAWKEYPSSIHPPAGERTGKVLSAVGIVKDVMDSIHKFLSLKR